MRIAISMFVLMTFIFAGCKKTDSTNKNTNPPVTAPSKILPSGITLNNIAVSPIVNIKLFSSTDNLLLYNFGDGNVAATELPKQWYGSSSYTPFSYSIKSYYLAFYTENNLYQPVEAGRVSFKLSDYSSDSIPKPGEMFYNQNGWAGTVTFSYQ
jgi:hypothetical protein